MHIHYYFLVHQNYNQLSNTYDPTTFQEELDSLNLRSLWTRDIYIPQEPVCVIKIKNNFIRKYFKFVKYIIL